MAQPNRALTPQMVQTPRLAMNVWTSGPEDGRPVLLVHGNLTTGGFWEYVAPLLPDDVRVLAPDMRSFGRTEQKPVDATRGLGDMVDDVHGLLETLGLTGGGDIVAAGWSMGGGILQQYLLEHPGDLRAVVLVSPISPYGFGGTTTADGQKASDDFAGSGGGTAAPDFVQRMREGDRSDTPGSPRVVLRDFFGARGNAANVDEDYLLDEALTTVVGDDFYPGNTTTTETWPGVAPGDRGVLNAMAPAHFDTSGLADVDDKPAITWVRAMEDQVISDTSAFDFAFLGQLGAVPGWPGAEVMPPQPMHQQIQSVLDRYAANGGEVRVVTLEHCAHGVPLEDPQAVADAITAHL
jgi:pimeloyl-ACP methyl ester carboxylesterase